MTNLDYKKHLSSWESLVTSYEQTRAGFISLALEKNRKATPFVEEAKALKSMASKIESPIELINVTEIKLALLTASGISDKAKKYLTENDQNEAIKGLIDNFLEPAGENFVDELVYRFLLTRGDSLGGIIRNLGGVLGERKITRMLIATLSLQGISYCYLHSKSKEWLVGSQDDADVEIFLKGLSWKKNNQYRTLIYNLTVPIVKKNVDLCLLNSKPEEFIRGKNKKLMSL
uniref:AvaI/BsoBI family type II restriction endonuclease n=1 Tax=Cyanothece sp. BG0011 TaxID=2082950 RepID=UPI0018E56397